MRGIITGPRHREILMGLVRISSPSAHAVLAPSLGDGDLRALRLQLSARGSSAAECSLPETLPRPLPACSLPGGTWGPRQSTQRRDLRCLMPDVALPQVPQGLLGMNHCLAWW